MSDPLSLEALKLRSRELEMDAVMIRGRVEEIHRLIYEMERRRGGRPRKGNLMQLGPDGIVRPIEMPQRVEGGIAETETEDSAA